MADLKRECDVLRIDVSKSERVKSDSISRGNQIKWKKGNL